MNKRRECILHTGRIAVRHEAKMLEAAAARLDGRFVDAVELIVSAKGRVVVSGLGKSGLVGRKIAATLASTGTAAFFVHAVEAHHGDAGMVLGDDVLVAISTSGETEEVVAFAGLAHGRGTAVIALTGAPESALGRQADVSLDVSVAHEADPFDLAPTASTIVTMAVGDALAIALMTLSGFTAEDFFRYHPRGALGQAGRERSRRRSPATGGVGDEV